MPRSSDPSGFDPTQLRDVTVTISQKDLATTITRGWRRAALAGIGAAVVTALVVSSITGLIGARVITRTVRHDVGRAAVFNCTRENRAASVGPALKRFLTTDARFNAKLGRLDVRSATIDRDLSLQLHKLGPVLPPAIASDYFAQSTIFQRLARLRAAAAELWAGVPLTGNPRPVTPSLERDVLTLTQAPCDKILLP